MDRLLSEQEICDTCPAVGMRTTEYPKLRCQPSECLVHPDLTTTAKAQLAKTDKEWVEWAFVICRNPSHSSGYWTKGNKLMQHQPRCECAECWQERKKALEASYG